MMSYCLVTRLTVIVALAVAGVVAATPARAADEMATLVPGAPAVAADLPAILSEADAKLYHRIFEIQEDGRWTDADRLIAKLTDRVLMGHVLAQRYLHPRKYRSHYKELKAWMAEYADHPEAGQLYKLALKRRPKNWLKPRAPEGARGPGMGAAYGVAARQGVPGKYRDTSQRRKARTIRNKVRSRLRNGWTKSVKHLLATKEVQTLLSDAEYDEARAQLGFAYFVDGRDDWALEWAGKAAKRSGKYLPRAYWTAGLAAWRLGRMEAAAENFEAVARDRRQSPWMIAAGAFWAARAHLVGRRPAEVNHWLGVAATYSRTFYGLLARRMLGLETRFDWAPPPLEAGIAGAVAGRPEGRRALALIQVGEDRMAERELRRLAERAGPGMARGILGLAARADMAALGVKLARQLFPSGGGFDGAAYPVPDWEPPGGFRVDRALIFALIRQESQFNPEARSYAGASGLMQLMPGTASFVARDRRYRSSHRRHLFEPETNLRLGQKYIELLLGDAKINGDLFLMVTAWNGGPGNLNKWRRQIKHMNDPLFFIEAIPSRETRNFIERVFTNLWIYRDRLGQPVPSLDAIAAGAWPVYIPQDQKSLLVAEDGKNRR